MRTITTLFIIVLLCSFEWGKVVKGNSTDAIQHSDSSKIKEQKDCEERFQAPQYARNLEVGPVEEIWAEKGCLKDASYSTYEDGCYLPVIKDNFLYLGSGYGAKTIESVIWDGKVYENDSLPISLKALYCSNNPCDTCPVIAIWKCCYSCFSIEPIEAELKRLGIKKVTLEIDYFQKQKKFLVDWNL